MKIHNITMYLWQTQIVAFIVSLSIDSYSATSGSEVYNNLIKKYSDSSKFLNVEQFQLLLDSIRSGIVNATETKVRAICESTNVEECGNNYEDCLTAEELFSEIEVTNQKFDAKAFESACPIILSQLDSNVCQGERSRKQKTEKEKPTDREVWGLGLLFVTIISLCSLVGVSVLPFMEKAFYKQMLTVLIGLAVGSLSGSSVFHLIPQAFGLINSDNHHEYLNISLMVWGGIWVFFMTERIMKVISDAKQQRTPRKKQCKDLTLEMSSPTELLPNKNNEAEPLQSQTDEFTGCSHPTPGTIYDYQEQAIKASFGHQEKARVSHSNELVKFEPGKDSAIATVAWMVIFGDGLHNFIDGLSIGAAFNESILTGISISLAVLCEEFPHELGDFAVLLNAGMSMRQALLYNFLSACTCYLGLILGILLGEIEASTYIFGFAAGMFLYISLVDMVPEMNEVAEEASKLGVKNACKTLLLQNIGMGIGMFALYILARYQDTFAFT